MNKMDDNTAEKRKREENPIFFEDKNINGETVYYFEYDDDYIVIEESKFDAIKSQIMINCQMKNQTFEENMINRENLLSLKYKSEEFIGNHPRTGISKYIFHYLKEPKTTLTNSVTKTELLKLKHVSGNKTNAHNTPISNNKSRPMDTINTANGTVSSSNNGVFKNSCSSTFGEPSQGPISETIYVDKKKSYKPGPRSKTKDDDYNNNNSNFIIESLIDAYDFD